METTEEGVTTYTIVEAVAKIGDVKYATLDAAVAAAQDGDTIVMLKDVEIESITIDKTITLDLNGKEISSAASELFVVTGDLTINGNGKITGPSNGAAFDSNALIRVSAGKLTIENGTLTATGSGSDGMYGVYVLNGGTAVFGTANGGPTGEIAKVLGKDEKSTDNALSRAKAKIKKCIMKMGKMK